MNGKELLSYNPTETDIETLKQTNPNLYNEYVKEKNNQENLSIVNGSTTNLREQAQNIINKLNTQDTLDISSYKEELKKEYKFSDLNTDVIDAEDELQRIQDLMD